MACKKKRCCCQRCTHVENSNKECCKCIPQRICAFVGMGKCGQDFLRMRWFDEDQAYRTETGPFGGVGIDPVTHADLYYYPLLELVQPDEYAYDQRCMWKLTLTFQDTSIIGVPPPQKVYWFPFGDDRDPDWPEDTRGYIGCKDMKIDVFLGIGSYFPNLACCDTAVFSFRTLPTGKVPFREELDENYDKIKVPYCNGCDCVPYALHVRRWQYGFGGTDPESKIYLGAYKLFWQEGIWEDGDWRGGGWTDGNHTILLKEMDGKCYLDFGDDNPVYLENPTCFNWDLTYRIQYSNTELLIQDSHCGKPGPQLCGYERLGTSVLRSAALGDAKIKFYVTAHDGHNDPSSPYDFCSLICESIEVDGGDFATCQGFGGALWKFMDGCFNASKQTKPATLFVDWLVDICGARYVARYGNTGDICDDCTKDLGEINLQMPECDNAPPGPVYWYYNFPNLGPYTQENIVVTGPGGEFLSLGLCYDTYLDVELVIEDECIPLEDVF